MEEFTNRKLGVVTVEEYLEGLGIALYWNIGFLSGLLASVIGLSIALAVFWGWWT